MFLKPNFVKLVGKHKSKKIVAKHDPKNKEHYATKIDPINPNEDKEHALSSTSKNLKNDKEDEQNGPNKEEVDQNVLTQQNATQRGDKAVKISKNNVYNDKE